MQRIIELWQYIYICIHSKHSVYPSCVYLSICFECREMFVSRKEEICSRDCSLYHFYVATRTKRHERIRSAIEAYVRSNVRKVKICYRRSECRRRNVVEQSCTMVDSSTTGESSLSELDRLGRSDLGYPAIRLPVPLFFPFHLLRLVVIRQPNSRHTPPVSFHPPRATLPVLLSFKSNSRRGSNDRPTDFTAWNFGVPTTFPSSFSAFFFFFSVPFALRSSIELAFFSFFPIFGITTRYGIFFFFSLLFSRRSNFPPRRKKFTIALVTRRKTTSLARGEILTWMSREARSSRGKLVVENSRREASSTVKCRCTIDTNNRGFLLNSSRPLIRFSIYLFFSRWWWSLEIFHERVFPPFPAYIWVIRGEERRERKGGLR